MSVCLSGHGFSQQSSSHRAGLLLCTGESAVLSTRCLKTVLQALHCFYTL